MTTEGFTHKILQAIPHEPTAQQAALAGALSQYCSVSTPPETVFILAGYAGTGKTTVIGALVKVLPLIGMKAVLLAPTGRAAKVLASHAGRIASTIHRRIYTHGSVYNGMEGERGLAENRFNDTLFIVDEASMISATTGEGGDNLLDDLLQYVFSGDNNRLIFSGDTAQLPPPGQSLSAAMDPDIIMSIGMGVQQFTLTDVVRQAALSGIIYNATLLRRNMVKDPVPTPQLVLSRFDDVKVLDSEDLIDELDNSYRRDGAGDTLLITRSNSRAVRFNLAIRNEILDYESFLVPGERVMICKNNYYWGTQVKGLDLVANGDIAVVEHVYGSEVRDTLLYADVTLRLPDRDLDFDCKLLLTSLTDEAPGLTPDHQRLHFNSCIADPERWAAEVPYEVRLRGLRTDPYYNALQVKYAYAVTCHKAQGGQWGTVFIDMGGITPEALRTVDFYRWLYTAETRATRRLYFVGSTLKTH